ncbi:MAG TPA: ammonium transporter [bacterium]|nr:ammonium transporter [bacterium]
MKLFKRLMQFGMAAGLIGLTAAHAFAADGQMSAISAGDTAWVIISAALVMLMTPALGYFYGGMVRRKNVLAMIMQNFILVALISVTWVIFGYSMCFGPDKGGLIGGLDWAFLKNVGFLPNTDYAGTIPHQLFMMYQLMFAIITPALITGAFADRMKFSSFLVFMVLWATLVYNPVCHWVWGVGGWLRNKGVLDFAGGTVVHVNAGIAALAAILVIGKRKGYGTTPMPPHNMTLTVLGTAFLWFGWFGFNAGSALGANALAVNAFMTTNTAAATATLSWVAVEWIHRGKPTTLGAASGAVAGLVAITPAAGFVDVTGALAIGGLVSLLCYGAIMLKSRLGYDDALDVIGVHCVGGIFGALATGVFATKAVNEAGNNGLLYGNPGQLGVQALSVLITLVYSFAVSFILLKIVDKVMGLRVDAEEEYKGLDITQHGEEGYILD